MDDCPQSAWLEWQEWLSIRGPIGDLRDDVRAVFQIFMNHRISQGGMPENVSIPGLMDALRMAWSNRTSDEE